MFKNMMLNAKFKDYVDRYELEGEPEEDNEKRYICYTYLSQIQPERLDRDFDLLDKICNNDLLRFGVIGLAITLNNQLLTAKTDIDDILQGGEKGKFDLYLFSYEKNINIEQVISLIIKENSDLEFAEIIKSYVSDYKEKDYPIEIVDYTGSGRVNTLKIGEVQIKATELRKLTGIRSTNFRIEKNENGQITFYTIGYGHGVGMSQEGANSMAKSGSKYDEIIKHYYTGVEITIAN